MHLFIYIQIFFGTQFSGQGKSVLHPCLQESVECLELQVYEENQEDQGKMGKLDNLVYPDKRCERLTFAMFVICQVFIYVTLHME